MRAESKREPRGARDRKRIAAGHDWTVGVAADKLADLCAENARLQKALDTREAQYIKLLHTGDAILEGVQKLLRVAGWRGRMPRLLLAGTILLATMPARAETTIRGSIDAAVEKTLQEQPEVEELVTRRELETRLAWIKLVADSTASCVREGFFLTGMDIVSGAAAWKFCPECEEANPLGIDKEGRLGMKVASLGLVIERCYAAAKSEKPMSGTVKWINRIVTGLVIANNVVSAAKGTPLVRWGVRKDSK
jgi:hypothetical protein